MNETEFTYEEVVNPDLVNPVITTNPLETLIVNYVGEKNQMEEGSEVTIEMIAEVFADEFPTFLLAIGEENFVRGYEEGVEEGMQIDQPGKMTSQEAY